MFLQPIQREPIFEGQQDTLAHLQKTLVYASYCAHNLHVYDRATKAKYCPDNRAMTAP